jgi:hypothetical protein
MEKVYIPYINADKTEGKGPMVPLTKFGIIIGCKDENFAGILSIRHGEIYGVPPSNPCANLCQIVSSQDEIDKIESDSIREHALAKLTEKEKEVLGLI